jgi:N-acetylneuraminate synthase
VILEKHFTHDKTLPGNDHYHAMDVDDLKRLVNLFKRTHELLGNSVHKEPIANESLAIKNARRSIVAKCNLSKGDVIKADDLTYKRPGFGISPIHWDEVIGRRVARDVEPDHILHWQDIET